MNHITVHETLFTGLYVLERHPLNDERGFLERLFCQEELNSYLQDEQIRQINHTFTRNKGTVRGLHYQIPPFAETKIISCLRGEVFDVAVDLRKDSPTFLQRHEVILSAENFRSFLIPKGFAHGFQTLTHDCEILYFHTADYKADAENGFNAHDPKLNISWPLPVTDRSVRDSELAKISSEFSGIEIS